MICGLMIHATGNFNTFAVRSNVTMSQMIGGIQIQVKLAKPTDQSQATKVLLSRPGPARRPFANLMAEHLLLYTVMTKSKTLSIFWETARNASYTCTRRLHSALFSLTNMQPGLNLEKCA